MQAWLSRRPLWQIAAIIAAAGISVYGASIDNGFVSMDDGLLITENAAVHELTPQSVWHVFTSYEPELYAPLGLVTYQIEHALFGLNASVFHVTNLALHILTALLVFACTRMLSGKRSVGFLVALLFVTHPINVEAVAWAAARKDVLSGFFFFASLLCFLLWRERSENRWRWLCLAAFALGLFSKASIVSLPLILVATDWMRGRSIKRSIVDLWPMFGLSMVFGFIAIGGKTQSLAELSVLQYLLLACKSTLFYLAKIFAPINLSVLYPQTNLVSIANPEFLVAIILMACLAIMTIVLARRSRMLAFGPIFFFLALAPNLLHFSKGGFLFFASDRYAYLAAVGIFFILSIAADRALRSANATMRRITAVASIIVIIGLSALTIAQNRTWRDSEALYRNTLKHYPNSWMAWNNLGEFLAANGNDAQSLEAFEQATRITGDVPMIFANVGSLHRRLGDMEQAIDAYLRAIDAAERKARVTQLDLTAYYALAEIYDSMGKPADAMLLFEEAANIGKRHPEPQYNLGLKYQQLGRLAEAERAFREAAVLQSHYLAARYHLAAVLAEQGKLAEALTELEALQAMSPGYEQTEQHIRKIQQILVK